MVFCKKEKKKVNGDFGFQDLKVNLIMTDYSMPGMTGYELLKKIKVRKTIQKSHFIDSISQIEIVN